jgi:pimeloyl-ACP methyl ester carboxylesterase
MTARSDDATTKSIVVNGTPFIFREMGEKGGTPVVFLHHLTGVLEDWDPRVLDGMAANHHVVIFDNRGVGPSGGSTPNRVEEMAVDAVAFMGALGFGKVDLFGFSLGGFIAQVIVQRWPRLVRKIVLAGTGPAGGESIGNVDGILREAFGKSAALGKPPKHFLFFTQSASGQVAADDFHQRLQERAKDRDAPATRKTIKAQLAAIRAWSQGDPAALTRVEHPALVAHGDHDIMVPLINSIELARRLPNAQLSIFPDAGHGGIFQYHACFVQQALSFLR